MTCFLMSQPMYRIKNGSLKGYSICEMCGSVLDIYLDYHQCLLQPEIIQAHMELLKDLTKCPFHLCNSSNDSVKDYMNHLLLFHSSVVIFSCPTCGIGFHYHIWFKTALQLLQSSLNIHLKCFFFCFCVHKHMHCSVS